MLTLYWNPSWHYDYICKEIRKLCTRRLCQNSSLGRALGHSVCWNHCRGLLVSKSDILRANTHLLYFIKLSKYNILHYDVVNEYFYIMQLTNEVISVFSYDRDDSSYTIPILKSVWNQLSANSTIAAVVSGTTTLRFLNCQSKEILLKRNTNVLGGFQNINCQQFPTSFFEEERHVREFLLWLSDQSYLFSVSLLPKNSLTIIIILGLFFYL